MVKPVPTETTFEYDAIGNLIWDHDTDVKISWTPYGKVREVTNEGEEMVTTFRYDGSGNRIEKKVVKQEGGEEIVSTSRYVRDASGNVMAIYKDEVMQEQPVYGSNRLGMFKGGIAAGQQMLAKREYELSNHLGNVLAVISDKVGMDGVDVYATEISVSDYYPFGLNMEGRGWQDTDDDYRYGFNGKEKDDSEEFGNTHYDYGFRIYNPSIGRFLSVDPLTKEYPFYTPYQFAGNKPIVAIDIDGLEEWIVNDGNGGRTNIGGSFENQAAAQAHFDQNMSVYGTTLLTNSDGMINSSNRIESHRIPELERKAMSPVRGIILHRTVSSGSKSPLTSFKNREVGTHFLVGKDGRIYQTASLNQYTIHLRDNDLVAGAPKNKEAMGIEVVGNYNDQTKQWDPLTERQTRAVAFLTNSLLQTYNLQQSDIYNHEDVQAKTAGEGQTVYNAIAEFLPNGRAAAAATQQANNPQSDVVGPPPPPEGVSLRGFYDH